MNKQNLIRALCNFNTIDFLMEKTTIIPYKTIFLSRPLVEEVRNCTKVAKDVQNEILQIVVEKLLAVKTTLPQSESDVAKDWNVGGTVAISQISESVPARLLAEIKNECGGLQVKLELV
jgi:hypothetical protein